MKDEDVGEALQFTTITPSTDPQPEDSGQEGLVIEFAVDDEEDEEELSLKSIATGLQQTTDQVRVAGQMLDVFVDKDGNRWVTLENDVRVMIDGDGNVLAGPAGMASVKPGAKKKPTADMTDVSTTPSAAVQPAAADVSTTSENPVQKPKSHALRPSKTRAGRTFI